MNYDKQRCYHHLRVAFRFIRFVFFNILFHLRIMVILKHVHNVTVQKSGDRNVYHIFFLTVERRNMK